MTNESRSHERTGIETECTVYDRDGPRLRTDSANVAEAHSRAGFRVTAVTGGA